MQAGRVYIIAETPSLAASLCEVLEAEGVDVKIVRSLDEVAALVRKNLRKGVSVLVSACNGYRCLSARGWAGGPLQNLPLVVVGTRDPALKPAAGLHIVRLPLVPQEFIELVNCLLGDPLAFPPGMKSAGSGI